MKLGLGLGLGRFMGSAISLPTIATSPTFTPYANYPGAAYSATYGLWTGSPTITRIFQTSVDNSTWSDTATASSTTGTLPAAFAGLYVRIKETPSAGSPAYSNSVLLGSAYDQVLSFTGNGNYVTIPFTAPLGGLDLLGGDRLWLHAMVYYSGSGLENSAALLSVGSTSRSTTEASLTPTQTAFRDGGAGAYANNAPAGIMSAAGWYLCSAEFKQTAASTIKTTHFLNAVTSAEVTASTSFSFSNFTAVRIGDKALSTGLDTTTNNDLTVCNLVIGSGPVANAHAWAYNSGQLRRIQEYPNFAADGAAILYQWEPIHVSGGSTTFVVGDVGGTFTSLGTPTYTGTGWVWASRKPGFIDPTGDPPTTPATYSFPKYFVTAGQEVTLCSNTVAAGSANPALFTYTSIVHSVDGAVTITAGKFTPASAGTVTFTDLAYNGGSAVTFTLEVLPALAMPADPQFRTLYSGNARAAAIQSYTSPGAGTTYANAAALATAIDGMASGATLIVADLSDTGSALTIPAKDYGGATVTCTNRHGVVVNAVVATGALNLTLRGIEATTGFSGTGVSGLVLDHCRGRLGNFTGASGSTSTVTATNWVGYDDGTNGQWVLSSLKRFTWERFAHANISNVAGDNLHMTNVQEFVARRGFVGFNKALVDATHPDPHPDNIQTYGSGAGGYTAALVEDVVAINSAPGASERGTEGLFFTGINSMGLRFNRCAIVSTLDNSGIIGKAQQGCSIENTFGSGTLQIQSDSTSNSSYANNNVMGGYGGILASGSLGTETGTVNYTTVTDVYPQYVTHAPSWEMFDNPAVGYTTAGPYALIAELAASKAAYP